MDLTDDPWEVLHTSMPAPPRRPDGGDRPWRATKAVLHGIRWSLRTGAPWPDLPERYPPDPTGPRRLPHGVRSGGFARIL
jgi:transposase